VKSMSTAKLKGSLSANPADEHSLDFKKARRRPYRTDHKTSTKHPQTFNFSFTLGIANNS
jgi:hypothetical protein